MKKVLFLFLILLLPVVYAEEKYVPINVTVEINKRNLTLWTDDIVDKSTYQYFNINNSTNVKEKVSFIIKKDISCLTTDTANLTEKLIDACTIISEHVKNCDAIYSSNTELSRQVANMTIKMENQQSFKLDYDRCLNEKSAMLTQESCKNSEACKKQSTNWKYFAGAEAVALFIIFMFFEVRKKTKYSKTPEREHGLE